MAKSLAALVSNAYVFSIVLFHMYKEIKSLSAIKVIKATIKRFKPGDVLNSVSSEQAMYPILIRYDDLH